MLLCMYMRATHWSLDPYHNVHNEPVSWLQWSVDLILPGLSVGLMSQYSGLLPPLPCKWTHSWRKCIDIQSKMEAKAFSIVVGSLDLTGDLFVAVGTTFSYCSSRWRALYWNIIFFLDYVMPVISQTTPQKSLTLAFYNSCEICSFLVYG